MRYSVPYAHGMRNQPHHGFPVDFTEINHIAGFCVLVDFAKCATRRSFRYITGQTFTWRYRTISQSLKVVYNTCGPVPPLISSEQSVQGGQSKPTRTKSSGSFHQNLPKRAHSVDLTDINRKHQICFQARDRLQPREGDIASAEGGSRPDIAFAVGRCMRFVANPSGEYLAAAKCILRYLKGTVGVSLSVRTPTSEWMLAGWTNSDWAGSCNCRRPTSGWSSRLQPMVANSSIEAEYVALAAAARELLWTSMFLHKLEQPAPKTARIHHFKRMKHIDIAHFFLWDKIASWRLTVAPVQSSENLVDILTKLLTAPTLLHLRELFGLMTSKVHTGLRGGAGDNNPVEHDLMMDWGKSI
ncbi:uncharacterized protein UBRO_21059 [Ustilago bromivora]|uniref:Reverse transcriptase Ty1/copia-type domain-containing protein n=1 Tax=Ustilago bromivora TaxID=307758 RepID=A0A1K0G0A7_9BASI|nr:uncharacterized protein UBRO_21059 [Ustilago bromivora]